MDDYRPGSVNGIAKLTHKDVIRRRFKIMMVWAYEAMKQRKPFPPVRHIWYPEDNLAKYSFKEGNAPPDRYRPKHLRGLDLWLDCSQLPIDLLEKLKPGGELERNAKIKFDLMRDIDPLIKPVNLNKPIIIT